MTQRDKAIVRIAEIEIDPDQIDAYVAPLSEVIEASVAVEPGVMFLHAVSIKDRPTLVRVIEGYLDQAAYEAHLTTPHFLRYKRDVAGMVLSLRLVETDVIAIRAKGRETRSQSEQAPPR
ncbi:MAG: putative quinol monooxygenase [Rhizobiaceae bacterium]